MTHKKFAIMLTLIIALNLILDFGILPYLAYQIPHTMLKPQTVNLTVIQANFYINEGYYSPISDGWNITVSNNSTYTVNYLVVYRYFITRQVDMWFVNATLNPTNTLKLNLPSTNGLEGYYLNVSFVVVGYTQ